MTFSLKSNNIEQLAGVFFLLIGIIVTVIFGFVTKSTIHFVRSSVITTGRITGYREENSSRNGTTSHAVVSFVTAEDSPITFTSNVGSSFRFAPVGQLVSVRYLRSDPQTAQINSFFELWVASIVLGIVGVTFVIAGSSILIGYLKSNALKKTLLATGQRIEATNPTVGRGNMVVNGQSSYQIHCQWLNPSNGEVYLFDSENIWFDPSAYFKDKPIGVYINPTNPKQYYVDISTLPSMA